MAALSIPTLIDLTLSSFVLAYLWLFYAHSICFLMYLYNFFHSSDLLIVSLWGCG